MKELAQLVGVLLLVSAIYGVFYFGCVLDTRIDAGQAAAQKILDSEKLNRDNPELFIR